jgi:superfamily I DNA/RNA helicase
MKILLAGPGTGKTTKIKQIIVDEFPNAEKIKVISFTNATVNDLAESFSQNQSVSCSTLHSFALKRLFKIHLESFLSMIRIIAMCIIASLQGIRSS